jgi:uroporphyrinogen decarboxylase
MFEEPDSVPIFEIPPSPKVLGQIFNEDPTRLSLKSSFEEDIRRIVGLYKKLGLDCFTTGGLGNPSEITVLNEDKWIDRWGRIFSTRYGYTTSSFYVGPYLTTPEKYENFLRPEPPSEFDLNVLKNAMNAAGDDIFVIAGVGSIWEVQGEAIGYENILRYIYMNPGFVRKVLGDTTNYVIEQGKASIDLGAEVLLIWDDYAYRHGPMMSPKHWKEFIFPCLKRVADEFHRRGAFLMLHSDGDIRLLMDMIIEAGVDIIQPLQPDAGMDIVEVSKRWGGKICLVGNIDVSYLLPFGSTEEVVESVRKAINAAAPGGGYMLGSGHMINDACKPENFLSMIKAGKKFGKYPIRY